MELFYDDYEVVEKLDRKNNNQYYHIRCKVCGHEKECCLSNMKKQDNHHSAFNCREDYYKILIGKNYGDYVCSGITHTHDDGYIIILKCKICGNEKRFNYSQLRDIKHSAMECRATYYSYQIGKKYGDLQIVECTGMGNNGMKYRCRCTKCGVESIRSIGALQKIILHGKECFRQIPSSPIKDAIWNRWACMNQRCNNPKHPMYPYYGGRGIRLHYEHAVDLYCDFAEEFKIHADKYGIKNSTFDRIDVNGDYEKSNLRIATQKIQSTNTRRKKLFIIEKNNEKVLSDSAQECGRVLHFNGRALGNVLRGKSSSCSGWRLIRIVSEEENIEDVIAEEKITKTLIVS